MTIFNSASRVVFMMVSLTLCAAFVTGIMTEANFVLLAGSAFTYYFTRDNGKSINPESE